MKVTKEKKELSELIRSYQEGDSFLKTPIKTILGRGCKKKIKVDEPCTFNDLESAIQNALSNIVENGEEKRK